MSENIIDQPTQKETPQVKENGHDENLRAVFEDLRNFGVSPIAVLQGGEEFNELAPRADAEIRNRPFLVAQAVDANGENQIYKRRVGEDPRDSANNESFFLQSIAPEIMAKLPERLKNVIRFPNLKGRHTDQRSFVEEYFRGEIMGNVHRASTDLFTSDDLQAIADAIKVIQVVGGKWLGDPNLHLKDSFERKVYGKYAPDLQKREKGLRSTLGNESYEQLTALIENKKDLLLSEEAFLAGSDVQTSNIIKMEKGQLGMIDWERINVTNNPALDYGFMYAVLWDNPQLQEGYLHYVLSQNQDRPNFGEYFRLDFIFNRGTGELNHWWNRMQEAKAPDEKAECEMAIGRYVSLMRDALGKKGIWEDSQVQASSTVAGAVS